MYFRQFLMSIVGNMYTNIIFFNELIASHFGTICSFLDVLVTLDTAVCTDSTIRKQYRLHGFAQNNPFV